MSDVKQIKRTLLEAAREGIAARISDVRGWHFLSCAKIQTQDYKTLIVEIPGTSSPRRFKISVTEDM